MSTFYREGKGMDFCFSAAVKLFLPCKEPVNMHLGISDLRIRVKKRPFYKMRLNDSESRLVLEGRQYDPFLVPTLLRMACPSY